VRILACLALFTACNSKHPPAKQEPVAPAKRADQAASDPWDVADGSGRPAEPAPKWASDPPAVLRDKINAVNAHVMVLKATPTFAEYRDVLKIVERTPGVVAAEPFSFVEQEITVGKTTARFAVKGVDPARVDRVLAIGPHMKTGSLAALAKGKPPPIVLGDVIAKQLGVAIGDDVTLSPIKDAPDPTTPTVFRVAGTFLIGFDEYDERLGIAPLAAVQTMMGRGDQVIGVEAIVDDLDRSDEIAEAIENKLGGPPYQAQDWYALNHALFTALYGDRRP